ncbi:acetyl-CoA acetyltransferase [Pseudooceanicola aestuarii]|uniref:acetyl-CoA acetyltransferase n=1 Tax=Pseudooceanicola aestuarii TaxID=2697319 RepID=UPI0013D06FFA|nr:acetyl-CoA acetyltransferase [Pseudooceanicola aestuarii]
MTQPIFILGGHQTDFAISAARRGEGLFDLMQHAVQGALADAQLDAGEIQSAHVGNFTGEMFAGQGQLGGMFAAIDPALYGRPAGRHEAACASGSIAMLAATAEIEAGRYDCVLVTGVELERNVSGKEAAQNLGAAMWVGTEGQEATYPWPYMFHRVAEEYDRRYGLKYDHLAEIARLNIENGRRNPNAQTRDWQYTAESFTADDDANPVIEGMIRRQDCAQITDGAAAVVLASESYARAWAEARGLSLDDLPRIAGWGHTTAHLRLQEKLDYSRDSAYIFPHVRDAIQGAFARAGIADVAQVDGIETHDCFSSTEYMAIDHFGITPPGESWRAVENGDIALGGRIPVNPGGGLIGGGHPVGATGVRMVLDAARQVTGRAGAYQVEGAHRFATLNLGGSATTIVTFVVEAGA